MGDEGPMGAPGSVGPEGREGRLGFVGQQGQDGELVGYYVCLLVIVQIQKCWVVLRNTDQN